jgi:hypothetical protein
MFKYTKKPMKKSKRLSLIKRKKSLKDRKFALKQNSRRNFRFVKRGGEVVDIQKVDEALNTLTTIREEQGDLPLISSQKRVLSAEELSKLNPDQLMAYLREMRKDKKPTDLWVEMGQKGIKRVISNYTDDVIKILLNDYDINSLKLLFVKNAPKLNLSMIRKYLPNYMWASFGGVDNFVNWLNLKVYPILDNENETSTIPKPSITKDTIPMIIRQLKEKYPDVDMSDNTVRDLILTDLFKKIYYLYNNNSREGVQLGGDGEFVEFALKGLLVLGCIGFIITFWPLFLIGGIVFGFKLYERGRVLSSLIPQYLSDIQKLQSGEAVESGIYDEAERDWKSTAWERKRSQEELFPTPHRELAISKPYQDAFIDDKVRKYEIHEATLLNQLDEAQKKAQKTVDKSGVFQGFGF